MIVIVGKDGWDEFTLPCIESIKKYEPNSPMLLIDNNSDTPWPKAGIHLKETVSYAETINIAADWAFGLSDWFVLINNDVLCDGPFVALARRSKKKHIWGNKIFEEEGKTWVDGWLWIFHKRVWDKIGPFDPMFEIAAFEDADWCFRGELLGIKTMQSELPFRHLEHSRRKKNPRFKEVRQANLEYLREKHDLASDFFR